MVIFELGKNVIRMNFLRNLLASILGGLVAFAIIMGMFIFFVALVGNADQGVAVKDNSVLEIGLTGPLLDYAQVDPTDPFAGLGSQVMALDEVLHAIAVAKTDNKIKGISMTTGFSMAGLAQIREIREALLDFKESGKFILAHSDIYTQKDYYLATVADRMYISPLGVLDFRGLATEVLYYKGLQEKSGISIEVIRHGKYKSAVEPFLSDSMSGENRTQIKELITSIWDVMVSDISVSRDLAPAALNRIADTLGGRSTSLAVASGLLDGVLHHDQYEDLIGEELGLEDQDRPNYVKFGDYVRSVKGRDLSKSPDKIALIFAQGPIFYGEGGRDYIGQGLIVDALEKAAKAEEVKAIVFRVDSPGGSAQVSEIIWRAMELAKEEKPLVVSFGNVAASGGYYIGVAGDKIFADPTTITGSIGVFGTIPNVRGLAENIGINAEQVGTNRNSVDYSVFEPMDESFRKTMEESIEETYQVFLERVAQGRNMSLAQVDSLAQGRVWSGADAVENGLVDSLGFLEDAIAEAAAMAGLESYALRKYPKYKSEFQQFMEDFGGARTKLVESFIQEEIGDRAFRLLKDFKRFEEQQGIQARMPYTLDIK